MFLQNNVLLSNKKIVIVINLLEKNITISERL